ncbi:MAG: hypothetical protein OXN83_06190, partial [Oligoflexia bacterium]|nr:hypothetical protein [Oligoflexia bacterium]
MLNRHFFVCLFFLALPLTAWAFSETELDSLESSGSKSLSQSPWRTQVSFSLQRNTLLNSSYIDNTGRDISNPWSFKTKDSLLDPSSLYYAFSLNLNYSLAKKIKERPFLNWLKKTELFLSSSFRTPFFGYRRNELKGYSALDYIHYALGDIALG